MYHSGEAEHQHQLGECLIVLQSDANPRHPSLFCNVYESAYGGYFIS